MSLFVTGAREVLYLSSCNYVLDVLLFLFLTIGCLSVITVIFPKYGQVEIYVNKKHALLYHPMIFHYV